MRGQIVMKKMKVNDNILKWYLKCFLPGKAHLNILWNLRTINFNIIIIIIKAVQRTWQYLYQLENRQEQPRPDFHPDGLVLPDKYALKFKYFT